MNLTTTQDHFEALHKAADKARSNAKQVSVPKEALEAVLRDHSQMYHEITGGTIHR